MTVTDHDDERHQLELVHLDEQLDAERVWLEAEIARDPLGFYWFGPRDPDGKRR
jgi:hypothetical protein